MMPEMIWLMLFDLQNVSSVKIAIYKMQYRGNSICLVILSVDVSALWKHELNFHLNMWIEISLTRSLKFR